jgi:hypothetical protein
MRSLLRFIRTRRRTFAIGLALVVGFVSAALYFGSSRLTVEAYDRLRLGMTLAEVEAALGVTSGQNEPPPDRGFVVREQEETWTFDPSAHTVRQTGPGAGQALSKDTGEVVVEARAWADGDHMISVYLRDGRVVTKYHSTAMPLYEIWIRRQLGRLGF